MSANALTISVLVVLVLAAAALRVVIGPIAGGKDGADALAKIGPVPGSEAARVEMARSGVRRGE
jgi:hypothetical protein